MLKQNIFFHENYFRSLFDKTVQKLFGKKIPYFNIDSSYIFISEIPKTNSPNDCKPYRGKWSFKTSTWDYSCSIYDAVETVRQAILSAKKLNKCTVEIPLVYSMDNPDYVYLVNTERQVESVIDIEKLKQRKAFHYNHTKCQCDIGIPRKILSQLLEPALRNLMKKMSCKLYPIILKNKVVSEKSGLHSSLYYKRDLEAICIEETALSL